MATATGQSLGELASNGQNTRRRRRERARPKALTRPSAPAPTTTDVITSVPRLSGRLHLPKLARPQREWATSPQRYRVRVGWRTARVSDNVLDVLALIDGSRSIGELAQALAERQHRAVHAAEIVYLLGHRLVPAGLVSVRPVASKAGQIARAQVPAAAVASARGGAAAVAEPVAATPIATIAKPSVPLATTALLPSSDAPNAVAQPTVPAWHIWEAAETRPAALPAASAEPPPPSSPHARPSVDAPSRTPDAAVLPAGPAPGRPLILPLAPAPDETAAGSRSPRERTRPASEAVTGRPYVWQPSTPVRESRGPLRTWLATLGTWLAAGVGIVCLLIGLAAALLLNAHLPGASLARHGTNQPAQVVAQPTPPQERIQPGERAYTVRSGDTLGSIAGHYGVTPTALLIVNADILPPEAELVPGMRLAVPAIYRPGVPASAQPRPLYYAVRSGDTLYEIGQRFGTTWTAIAAYNQLADPRTLAIGQGLVIPPAGGQTH
jgi:LysM repeat protein